MKLFYLCFLCNVIFLRTVPAWGDSSCFVLWIAVASGCQSHLVQRVEFHVKLWFMGHSINIRIAYFPAQPYPSDVSGSSQRDQHLSAEQFALFQDHSCPISVFPSFCQLSVPVPWERHFCLFPISCWKQPVVPQKCVQGLVSERFRLLVNVGMYPLWAM